MVRVSTMFYVLYYNAARITKNVLLNIFNVPHEYDQTVAVRQDFFLTNKPRCHNSALEKLRFTISNYAVSIMFTVYIINCIVIQLQYSFYVNTELLIL